MQRCILFSPWKMNIVPIGTFTLKFDATFTVYLYMDLYTGKNKCRMITTCVAFLGENYLTNATEHFFPLEKMDIVPFRAITFWFDKIFTVQKRRKKINILRDIAFPKTILSLI